MKRLLLAVSLALALFFAGAPLHATTCANAIPANAIVTPDCTWIVAQYDPGVWLDQLGQYWIQIAGLSLPMKVKLGDLKIGR